MSDTYTKLSSNVIVTLSICFCPPVHRGICVLPFFIPQDDIAPTNNTKDSPLIELSSTYSNPSEGKKRSVHFSIDHQSPSGGGPCVLLWEPFASSSSFFLTICHRGFSAPVTTPSARHAHDIYFYRQQDRKHIYT